MDHHFKQEGNMPANGQQDITHKPLNKPGPQHDTPQSRILEMGLLKIQNK